MKPTHRTLFLTVAGFADLGCFALGGLGYGDVWEAAGALGLIAWLVLIELTR